MKMSRTNAFSVTVVPEIKPEPLQQTQGIGGESVAPKSNGRKSPDDGEYKPGPRTSPSNSSDVVSTLNNSIEKSDSTAESETARRIDPDDRLIRPPYNGGGKKSLSQTSVNGFIKPHNNNNNIQLYSTMVGVQSKNE